MFKIRKSILFIFILGIALLLSGCGSSNTAPKCKVDTDCSVTAKCTTASCLNGYCATKSKSNCCGNKQCEEAAAETKCTCDVDCGKCTGTIKVKDSKGKLLDSTYLKMLCDDTDECVASYDKTQQKPVEVFNEFASTGFKFNVYVKYDQPFDKKTSKFNVEFNLKDLDETRIQAPVSITEIRIMESGNVIARKSTGLSFNKIGDKLSQGLDVSYILSQAEETKSLSVNIDYELTPLMKSKDTYVPQQTQRKTYAIPLTNKVTLLDTSLAK